MFGYKGNFVYIRDVFYKKLDFLVVFFFMYVLDEDDDFFVLVVDFGEVDLFLEE